MNCIRLNLNRVYVGFFFVLGYWLEEAFIKDVRLCFVCDGNIVVTQDELV